MPSRADDENSGKETNKNDGKEKTKKQKATDDSVTLTALLEERNQLRREELEVRRFGGSESASRHSSCRSRRPTNPRNSSPASTADHVWPVFLNANNIGLYLHHRFLAFTNL
jgi:hypothetical protein